MSRRRRAAALLATAALAGACATTAAGAGAGVPDPGSNLSPGPLPSACLSAPAGSSCERASIAALDRARARMGLARYRLPSHFTSMAPARQWLVLANLDRAAYGIKPIGGLARALSDIARQGAVRRTDPDPWPLLQSLRGQSLIGFGSNWAGGQPNALLAYYGWVYDDGPGSGNLACPHPGAAGCWGHRHNIFAFPHAPVLTMGAASVHPGTRTSSYALTIVETSSPAWPYTHTG